jgi:hypothetical protein
MMMPVDRGPSPTRVITVFSRRQRVPLTMTIMMVMAATVAVLALIGCRAPRQDLTAANTADTGPYDVVAQTQPEPRVYEIRVRVQNLDKATQIARDVVHQTAVFSPLRVRVLVLGPGDAPDAVPRRIIRWPEELDYRTP